MGSHMTVNNRDATIVTRNVLAKVCRLTEIDDYCGFVKYVAPMTLIPDLTNFK